MMLADAAIPATGNPWAQVALAICAAFLGVVMLAEKAIALLKRKPEGQELTAAAIGAAVGAAVAAALVPIVSELRAQLVEVQVRGATHDEEIRELRTRELQRLEAAATRAGRAAGGE